MAMSFGQTSAESLRIVTDFPGMLEGTSWMTSLPMMEAKGEVANARFGSAVVGCRVAVECVSSHLEGARIFHFG